MNIPCQHCGAIDHDETVCPQVPYPELLPVVEAFCAAARTHVLWRVGRKLGRTVYEGNRLVGVMDTPDLAAQVVAAVNAALLKL